MLVDEGDHDRDRRSSSAWAKYADAFLRISLACRSSRSSRSSALIRSRSSVVGPARTPGHVRPGAPSCAASRPSSRSWPRSSGSLPYCESCSPWCSSTIRTARSRTSGENGGVRFVMAPSSSWLQPRHSSSLVIAPASSWLHPRKIRSLQETRGGSMRRPPVHLERVRTSVVTAPVQARSTPGPVRSVRVRARSRRASAAADVASRSSFVRATRSAGVKKSGGRKLLRQSAGLLLSFAHRVLATLLVANLPALGLSR